MKLNPIVASCFLKLAKFITLKKHKIIYKANNPHEAFYIIIGGKVKLSNSEKGFKKICIEGEAIGEELLFQDPTARNTF